MATRKETKYKCKKCGVKAHSNIGASIPMFYTDNWGRTKVQRQCEHEWEKVGHGTG